ncbi:DUF2235 domain-containing protein [Marinihelvus fidelis]|uniref:DUF2235 domain-containing protein n=1 Tax=Marinihelvus fidelis TaxID=2613842 RepID=A0A5N0TJ90_9GAMM|nr:DUF2235 domain-containing protein [Marinihelvus fidelis]KAA9134177.1 DUF2235 domain-containing protein [Marinihelvus fidelis]
MKRLAIFTDGTWNSPEKGGETNVLHLARGVAPSHDGVKQVAFYDWGVGTDRKTMTGGITGVGIDKNIMDCYRFIVHNFDEGDELFLFGFSRGAYTARSLAGFIRNCGVLRREHASRIPDAYEMYRKRSDASGPNAPEPTAFRADYAWSDITPIEFVGAWDTVGALGIPVPFWGTLGEEEFLFHDTEPSKIINHARHAVAIDEYREDFTPTLWDPKPGIDLKQVWFSGVHSNVGGSYDDRGLSDTALKWMVDEASAFGLGFEAHALERIRPDHAGQLYNSRRNIYRLRGRHDRTITGPVHISVKQRWDDDVASYRSRCRPLKALLDSVDGDWSQVDIEP